MSRRLSISGSLLLVSVVFWLFTTDGYRSQAEAARTAVRLIPMMLHRSHVRPTRFAQDVLADRFNKRSPAHT